MPVFAEILIRKAERSIVAASAGGQHDEQQKEDNMGILSWAIFGVIAGAIARFIMPGRIEDGFVMTSLLGIVGACVGGFVGTSLGFGQVTGFNLPSFFIAVLGAMIVLIIYGRLRR